MNYIPAIDLFNGQCVRLFKGDFNNVTTYALDPLATAQNYERLGFQSLHLVDLNGASGNQMQLELIQSICKHTNLTVQLGGGLKDESAVEQAFANGVSRVIIGSMAVKRPLWVKELVARYGSDKIVLGLDVKGRKIAVNGWKDFVTTDYRVLLEMLLGYGIKEVICTQVERDGTLTGPDLNLYREILSHFEVNLIASGGISSLQDVKDVTDIGCTGVILGKALYENKIDPVEILQLS